MPKLSNSTSITNNLATDDLYFVVINDYDQLANVALISQQNYFSNVKVTAKFANVVTVDDIRLSNTTTPVNSTITVPQGKMWFDSNYLYVAIANNSLKRVALSSF